MRYVQSQYYSYRMARRNTSSSCLVCSTTCSLNNGFEIFSEEVSLGFKENPVTLLSKILNKEIKSNAKTIQLVCKKCYKLLQELDDLQSRVCKIKHVILDIRQSALKGTNEVEEKQIQLKLASGPSFTGQVEKDQDVSVTHRSHKNGEKAVKITQVVGQIKLEAETLTEYSTEDSDILDPAIYVKDQCQESDSEDNILESCDLSSKQSSGNGFEILQTVSSKTLPTENEHDPEVASSSAAEKEDRTFMCLFCEDAEAVVGDAVFISNHVKDVHGIELYICEVCGQVFQNSDSFSTHLDEHLASDDGDFQCEICNRIFNNRQLYHHHKTTHVGEEKKSVRTVSDLVVKKVAIGNEKIHKEISENVQTKLYTCDTCSKTFLNQQTFMEHVQTHGNEYSCNLCDKSFTSKRNLELHSIVHSVYKPFICGKCGKSFARKAEIRDHERIHTGEKPYQCELCGRTFSQRSNLQSHKRAAHFDDRRYVCEECGKGFKRRRLLDYHLKSAHTGERPYKCEDCNATFVYPEHFKKHRRIHTGEKPFHCEVCGKAFNCRDNRNAHRFIHSDKKPYECSTCGAGYMRKPLLYQHMQARRHINDTIIVNTPRLITDDNQCITWNEDGTVEIIALDSLTAGSDEDNKDNVLKEIEAATEEQKMNEDQACSYLIEGDFEEISADALADADIQTIDTPNGQYQLIKVNIPNEDGEEEETWIKIEPE